MASLSPIRQGELRTVRETAALLQLNVKTVRKLARAGRLETVWLGPELTRITRRSIDALIENGRGEWQGAAETVPVVVAIADDLVLRLLAAFGRPTLEIEKAAHDLSLAGAMAYLESNRARAEGRKADADDLASRAQGFADTARALIEATPTTPLDDAAQAVAEIPAAAHTREGDVVGE